MEQVCIVLWGIQSQGPPCLEGFWLPGAIPCSFRWMLGAGAGGMLLDLLLPVWLRWGPSITWTGARSHLVVPLRERVAASASRKRDVKEQTSQMPRLLRGLLGLLACSVGIGGACWFQVVFISLFATSCISFLILGLKADNLAPACPECPLKTILVPHLRCLWGLGTGQDTAPGPLWPLWLVS